MCPVYMYANTVYENSPHCETLKPQVAEAKDPLTFDTPSSTHSVPQLKHTAAQETQLTVNFNRSASTEMGTTK